MKTNYIEYELENGEFITMTISMALLYKLRAKDKKIYEKVSKNLVAGPDKKDVIEVMEFLHGAYACANQDEGYMSFEKFLEEMNQDYTYNVEKMQSLINPKKNRDSEAPS